MTDVTSASVTCPPLPLGSVGPGDDAEPTQIIQENVPIARAFPSSRVQSPFGHFFRSPFQRHRDDWVGTRGDRCPPGIVTTALCPGALLDACVVPSAYLTELGPGGHGEEVTQTSAPMPSVWGASAQDARCRAALEVLGPQEALLWPQGALGVLGSAAGFWSWGSHVGLPGGLGALCWGCCNKASQTKGLNERLFSKSAG